MHRNLRLSLQLREASSQTLQAVGDGQPHRQLRAVERLGEEVVRSASMAVLTSESPVSAVSTIM
jgi:hypothetical protein